MGNIIISILEMRELTLNYKVKYLAKCYVLSFLNVRLRCIKELFYLLSNYQKQRFHSSFTTASTWSDLVHGSLILNLVTEWAAA